MSSLKKPTIAFISYNKLIVKKFFFAYAWLLLSAGIILTGIAGINFFYLAKNNQSFLNQITKLFKQTEPSSVQLAELTTTGQVQGDSTIVETEDARAEIISNFLARYKSPMQPYDYYGQKLVEIADRYGIDFRLLPAIAMQESNLCKNIPEGTYNCLGFGIHERGTLGFENYEACFERAGKELKKYYVDKGLTTPEEIMRKYTPSSDGSWANSVMQWMAEMKYDDRELGREKKTNSSVLEYAKPASDSTVITITGTSTGTPDASSESQASNLEASASAE